MTPPPTPAEEARIAKDFRAAVNMTAPELRGWLETQQSREVGVHRRGESESVGRQSARRIISILETPAGELDWGDYAHMRKVVGYCRRHLAQRPRGDVTHTRWHWSLMNWGHDPLKR